MPTISPKSPANVANLARLQALSEAQALTPVWLRIPAASRVSGLSRTFIFEQITLGNVVSKHVKKPGKSRGIRLINYDSLMRFIEGLEG
jgi:hypothetical protein